MSELSGFAGRMKSEPGVRDSVSPRRFGPESRGWISPATWEVRPGSLDTRRDFAGGGASSSADAGFAAAAGASAGFVIANAGGPASDDARSGSVGSVAGRGAGIRVGVVGGGVSARARRGSTGGNTGGRGISSGGVLAASGGAAGRAGGRVTMGSSSVALACSAPRTARTTADARTTYVTGATAPPGGSDGWVASDGAGGEVAADGTGGSIPLGGSDGSVASDGGDEDDDGLSGAPAERGVDALGLASGTTPWGGVGAPRSGSNGGVGLEGGGTSGRGGSATIPGSPGAGLASRDGAPGIAGGAPPIFGSAPGTGGGAPGTAGGDAPAIFGNPGIGVVRGVLELGADAGGGAGTGADAGVEADGRDGDGIGGARPAFWPVWVRPPGTPADSAESTGSGIESCDDPGREDAPAVAGAGAAVAEVGAAAAEAEAAAGAEAPAEAGTAAAGAEPTAGAGAAIGAEAAAAGAEAAPSRGSSREAFTRRVKTATLSVVRRLMPSRMPGRLYGLAGVVHASTTVHRPRSTGVLSASWIENAVSRPTGRVLSVAMKNEVWSQNL